MFPTHGCGWQLSHAGNLTNIHKLSTNAIQFTVDRFGRRMVFVMNAFIGIAAGVCGMLAKHTVLFQLLFASRMGYGIVLGSGQAVAGM